ncbi:MAG TPA: hypothetical protein VHT51_18710 [Micropepsaceae bacterium]|jgi:hypothetical protein|nr:hypothetical protein [Micropepsaceae bacterium]
MSQILIQTADLKAEAAQARELASLIIDDAAMADLLAYAAELESGFVLH